MEDKFSKKNQNTKKAPQRNGNAIIQIKKIIQGHEK